MVTMDTTGLAVDGHFGTWHTIYTQQISSQDFYLMKHDEFGNEADNIIVDSTGKVIIEDVWNGFSPEILAMITKEQDLARTQPVFGNEANYLATAEGYPEENYNRIDARIDTQSKLTPGDDTESQPVQSKNKRPFVLGKLKEKQAHILAKNREDVFTTRSSNDISLE